MSHSHEDKERILSKPLESISIMRDHMVPLFSITGFDANIKLLSGIVGSLSLISDIKMDSWERFKNHFP